MKKLIILLLALIQVACEIDVSGPEKVFEVKGQQLTGICIDDEGNIYVNYPRWRKGVDNSVVQIINENESIPFPDEEWNSWEIGQEIDDFVFIAVQSIASYQGKIYVLDTRNPLFMGTVNSPRVFVFDAKDRSLLEVYKFSENSYHSNSYINDMRLNEETNIMFFTDSGVGGLIAMDLNNGKNVRILDSHISTTSEVDFLTINGKKWNNRVNSDGIALDTKKNILYYHSLTGYNLYSISTSAFGFEDSNRIEEAVKLEIKTPAPDGMILDEKGNLYFADLENNSINYLNENKEIIELYSGFEVSWADSFSILNNQLYYTNSRIHETGAEIDDLFFTVYKLDI